ncbi:uncharacterized protein LOC118154028 [Callithrix jacchus]
MPALGAVSTKLPPQGDSHRGIFSRKVPCQECCSGTGSHQPTRRARAHTAGWAASLKARTSGTPESGSSSLGIKLSPRTKPLRTHKETRGGQSPGMPSAAAGRQRSHPRPLPSAPTLFLRGKAAPAAQPRPAPPTRSPAHRPGDGAHSLTKPPPGRCGSPGRGAIRGF